MRNAPRYSNDAVLLELVMKRYSDLTDTEQKAFGGMRFRMREEQARGNVMILQPGQSKWLHDIARKLDIKEPAASPVVLPGSHETPAILRVRPLKPPGRT
jgi:hypothetical protein